MMVEEIDTSVRITGEIQYPFSGEAGGMEPRLTVADSTAARVR
jgi:hypothetical protein